jgi:LuxR family transcriptional regulator, regulator of acetate metabolism
MANATSSSATADTLLSADPGAALLAVGEALARLRSAVSIQALFDNATEALCDKLGFERAAVFSLRGHALVPESMCPPALMASRSKRFELGPGLAETEVLRRRRTLLVRAASVESRAIQLLPGSGPFVAAPIICHEQAVALVYADRGVSAEPVTELDRDTLRAFAEALGYALERCDLAERLRAHSERVLALVRSTEASVTELGSADFAYSAPRSRVTPIGVAAVSNGHLHSLLTRRELEVVAMLAEGETNARIAQRLVVSEDTVKSHVKHILRKLGVHNRSQAVSRYFQAQAAS